jgi:hypothetical protein
MAETELLPRPGPAATACRPACGVRLPVPVATGLSCRRLYRARWQPCWMNSKVT